MKPIRSIIASLMLILGGCLYYAILKENNNIEISDHIIMFGVFIMFSFIVCCFLGIYTIKTDPIKIRLIKRSAWNYNDSEIINSFLVQEYCEEKNFILFFQYNKKEFNWKTIEIDDYRDALFYREVDGKDYFKKLVKQYQTMENPVIIPADEELDIYIIPIIKK